MAKCSLWLDQCSFISLNLSKPYLLALDLTILKGKKKRWLGSTMELGKNQLISGNVLLIGHSAGPGFLWRWLGKERERKPEDRAERNHLV